MLRRERRYVSGFVNLDEAGGVPVTLTGAAHQRLLLRLQTWRQWKKINRAEPRVTTREIQECLSIGTAATMSILRDDLRVGKQCARWICHSLTDEQRRGRIEWWEFMLRKFNGGSSKLTWEMDET